MRNIVFRASALGKLMTEPKTKKEGELSVGAKTYIRELVQQDIFGVDYEFSSKECEKGIQVEDDSIELLNRVKGLNLAKNTERRTVGLLTGECDLYDAERKIGHDIKSSWSIKTFRGWQEDCVEKLYEYQMRAYMMLWDADEWHVDYCLVDTPEHLIGYEPLQLHVVSHIPENLRVTTWVVERDLSLESRILEKLEAAKAYYKQAAWEFKESHPKPKY